MLAAISGERIAKVTVGVPAYNEATYLGQQLEYLRTQEFADIEVLIYDNASTDTTPEIARRFCELDPRFRYIRQAENRGPLRNFNDVLQASRSPYFMWRACDDRSDKNYIAELVRVLDANPCAELAVSPIVTKDLEGLVLGESVRMDTRIGTAKSDRERRKHLFSYHASCIYGLFRRPLLAERMQTVVAEYADEFAADHLILFHYVFDDRVASTANTQFEQMVKSTAESRKLSRRSFSKSLARVLPLRRRFFRICRKHIDVRVGLGPRRLYWYAVAWLFVGRRVYKVKKIVVQTVSEALAKLRTQPRNRPAM